MADVTLYTAPHCPYSKLARELLLNHGVSFREYDVSADAAARAEMVRKSGQGSVPVLEARGELFVGFDAEVMRNRLMLA